MSRRDAVEFLALAAIWGASFLFMRVAAPEFGPLSLMLVRCAVGALTLVPVLLWYGHGRALVENAGRLLLVGALNSAIPFVLLGVAALSLSAGVTSILNSLAPLWTALIAWLWLGDRLTLAQALGLALGAIGVAVLVGGGGGAESGEASPTLGAVLLPFAAGVLATLFYGVGANVARRHLAGVPPLATATGSQLAATLVLLVPGVLWWPDDETRGGRTDGVGSPGVERAGGVRTDEAVGAPASSAVTGGGAEPFGADAFLGVPLGSWAAAIALGVVCTGVAYLLFFRLIASLGATRTITVTFVIPLFGVGWGALFLGERIDLATLAGGLIIVLGTALTTGVLRARRRVAGA